MLSLLDYLFRSVFSFCIIMLVIYITFLSILVERKPVEHGPPIREEELGLYYLN